jgi:hypothetical protein
MQVAMHGAGADTPALCHLPQALASHHHLLHSLTGLLIQALDGLQQLVVLPGAAHGIPRGHQV